MEWSMVLDISNKTIPKSTKKKSDFKLELIILPLITLGYQLVPLTLNSKRGYDYEN